MSVLQVVTPSMAVKRGRPSKRPNMELLKILFESKLLPKELDSFQKVVAVAQLGGELGLEPMESLMGIYVVNGMPALRGILMGKLIYKRVPGALIELLTPKERWLSESTFKMQRPSGVPQIFTQTMLDAERAGLTQKPVWKQYPETMLRWFAFRTGARIVFPDALQGAPYMEDEMELEFERPRDTPEPEPEELPAVARELSPPVSNFTINFGPLTGKRLDEVPMAALRTFVTDLRRRFEREKRPLGAHQELVERAEAFLRERAH